MVNMKDERKHISYTPNSEPLSSPSTGLDSDTPSSIVGIVRFSGQEQASIHRETVKANAEKIIQELATEAGLTNLGVQIVEGTATSNYMPHILNEDSERAFRMRERGDMALDETGHGLYRSCKAFTKKIRRALDGQRGLRFVVIFGLHGMATSWDRLVEFCGEEEPFHMLFCEPVVEDPDVRLANAVPCGPHGGVRFGLYNSKDLLLDPRPSHVQALKRALFVIAERKDMQRKSRHGARFDYEDVADILNAAG